ncbi:MAG TPA: ATP-binding cassette domain-containing protein [Acidimicrobiales bacterium]|nr:ATP-binding cassette domain-containing protein [Acidimicrobiales bacterium]
MTTGRGRAGLVGAGAIVALALPLVVRSSTGRADAANAVLLFVAAAGLVVAVGWAGMPSLGQGGFVGLGAYGTAIAQTRYHLDPLAATALGVLVASVAGAVMGVAVARLRAPFVALGTWLGAWAVGLAVDAFPAVTGGARGLVLPPGRIHIRSLGTTVHLTGVVLYEAAVLLALVTIAAVAAWRRRVSLVLAVQREDAPGAAAAGVDVARWRAGALTVSAVLAGAAGALLALVAGVADPTAYGPLLSVKLFLIVLVGGADRLLGAALGLAVLAVISPLAHAVGSDARAVEPAVTGALLLAVVMFGGVRWVRPTLFAPPPAAPPPAAPPPAALLAWDGAALDARELRVRFGGVQALDGVSLDVAAGSCHAIVGPNGSGKTTLLRVLAGVVAPDGGVVRLDGTDITHAPAVERRRLGLARTLQRPLRATGLTAFDVVLAGAEPRRRTGWWRALARTPQARREQGEAEGRATAALELAGLAERFDVPVERLHGAEQRLLQIAQALAGGARILLLDEPSAGMGDAEGATLRRILGTLRDNGLTVVLVEHDVGLVAALADRVTELGGAYAARPYASGPCPPEPSSLWSRPSP